MRKERMGVGMGLNLLLLLAMVAANILSFYHLCSSRSLSPSSLPSKYSSSVPDHLLQQLHTIRATISTLTHSSSSSSQSESVIKPPPELLLYSRLSPIASACSDHPELLHRFMNYTAFSLCPLDHSSLQEPLILRGCHPLPRRRCFSPTPQKSIPTKFPTSSLLSDSNVFWPPTSSCKSFSCLPPSLGFTFTNNKPPPQSSHLDLSLPQLLSITSPLTLAIDIGGGGGTLALSLKTLSPNTTVLTTTMNLGAPYNEAAAMRGVVPMHAPLQQRLPVPDSVVDLVRTGHAVNRWIPNEQMEFLIYDVDRVLKGGGWFWVDHFFAKGGDLERVYVGMLGRLGYKRVKWAVGNKTDASGIKNGEVYLTALLQKPRGGVKKAV